MRLNFPTRRHRFFVLALAMMVAGTFFIIVARGAFVPNAPEELRTCTASPLYAGLSFYDIRAKYHFMMEQLLEERMRLYEGTTLLQCDASGMENIIPPGVLATMAANSLSSVPDAPNFRYDHFAFLLHELWRTYDCHLLFLEQNASALTVAFGKEAERRDPALLSLARERTRARETFDRVSSSIRASEAYLPLHAALRCLQRGSVDVRNAMSLLSDAAQCFPARLFSPNTSIRK